jgi:CBS domain-containing protein
MTTVHPKKPPFAELTAGEIMQPSVISVGRRTALSEVERVLVDHRISGVPVTDEQGHVIGVVSMRDLVERYTEGATPRAQGSFYDAPTWDLDEEYGATTSVPENTEDVAADVMTAEVHAVDKTARVPEIARLMTKHEIHRVLVKDRGKFVGLVSSTDVVRAVAELK